MTDLRQTPRLKDWRRRLEAYLDEVARRPFAYGTHDCATMAADAVIAVLGADIAADYRGAYDTSDGGFAAIRAAGYDDHAAYFAAHFDEVSPSTARVGDLATVETQYGVSLAIVGSQTALLGAGIRGTSAYPRSSAIRAFRVGV